MDNEEIGYGSDFMVITDEDGNEIEIEILDAIEVSGNRYIAYSIADKEEEGVGYFKVVEMGGEELFSTIESDEEFERVDEVFTARFFEDEDLGDDEDFDED